MHENVLRT